ncbi:MULTISPECIES: YggT family protein [Enterococcus]|uniref:YggT family protein n=1 Tax=Candidatus Enterococcus ferrettii TaxID=2815324 RepID=A0ABV0EWL2_9ENTE|nr:YggT family protein [Enterococcus sp. 665A]MBO1338861.1 YggT family protein [Enterococcus sp. 665A]
MILFNLLNLINRLVNLYTVLLVVYALLSWFPGAYQSALGKLLGRICEPFLDLFRRLPLQFGGIDFSVMAAIIALNFIMRILNSLVYSMIY